MNKQVTCLNCGRVHFEVSLEYAKKEVADFNTWRQTQTQEVREMYGDRDSVLESYLQCMQCGSAHTQFRDAVEGDCPPGCTLSPIVERA